MATYSHLQRVPICNQDTRPLTVVVEPWAEEIVLAPGQQVVLTFEGPAGGAVEIEDKPGFKVLYGWPGSIFSVVSPQSGESGLLSSSSIDSDGRRSA